MKRIFLSYCFLTLHACVFAQDVITLNSPSAAGGTIVAGKLIRFAPGFAFKASTNASLRAYIDETLSGEEDPEDEPEIRDIHVKASGRGAFILKKCNIITSYCIFHVFIKIIHF